MSGLIDRKGLQAEVRKLDVHPCVRQPYVHLHELERLIAAAPGVGTEDTVEPDAPDLYTRVNDIEKRLDLNEALDAHTGSSLDAIEKRLDRLEE